MLSKYISTCWRYGNLRHWPLWCQIGVTLVAAMLLVSIIGGALARKYETPEVMETLRQQNVNNFNILHAAVFEGVISEDIPLLESIIERVVNDSSDITAIHINDESGGKLLAWENSQLPNDIEIMELKQPFVLEGERFGTIIMRWDVRSIYAEVEDHVFLTRMILSATLIMLTALIVLVMHGLTVRPIQKINDRLMRIAEGDLDGVLTLSGSKEFMRLGQSVNELSKVLQEKHLAELELRIAKKSIESLSQFNQLILSSVAEGIYGLDMEGEISFVNPAAANMLGWESAEMTGKPHNQVMHYSNDEGVIYLPAECPVLTTLNDGLSHHSDTDYLCRKNGSNFPVEYSSTPIREKGKQIGAVVVFRDIGERRSIERELREAIVQANQANKSKSDFLAVMSHEIRSPLNAIIGANRLLMDTSLDKEQCLFANTAARSGESLLALVNDVLDFSKLEAGRLDLEHSNFVLSRLVDEVKDIFTFDAEKKGIRITTRIDPEIPEFVNGDPGRLRQVLINLMGNAIKFTDSGKVDVRAKIVAEKEGQLTIGFSIKDTGIGIAKKAQQKLFQKFSQVDPSITRNFGGTGLGLAISKNIVELMGGSIRCQSEPGKGSVFQFVVNLVRSDPDSLTPSIIMPHLSLQEGDRPQSKPIHPRKMSRILLVEDSQANQVVALAILRKAGYKVDAVADGQEAITAVKSLPYDLILMDIAMPGMDGIEATKRIRHLSGDVSSIPIIAMTANVMEGDREKCLSHGMNDYLEKPIDRDALIRVIELWTQEAKVEKDICRLELIKDEDLLIDGRVLKQLEQDTSPELLPELVEIFVRETRTRLGIVKQACSESDGKRLQQEAHVLKSSAGTYGALRLQALAKKVDVLCKQGRVTEATNTAQKLLSIGWESLSKLNSFDFMKLPKEMPINELDVK